MLDSEFRHVCQRISNGAKFRMGRNATGRVRLKLHTGPFGLFVKRFEINEAEFERLRGLLVLARDARDPRVVMKRANSATVFKQNQT